MSDNLGQEGGRGGSEGGIHGPRENEKPRRGEPTGRARGTGGRLGDSREGYAEHGSNAEGTEEQPAKGTE